MKPARLIRSIDTRLPSLRRSPTPLAAPPPSLVPAHPEGHPQLGTALEAVSAVLLGRPDAIRMSFVALLAQGHVLLEDSPGLGKTTLARCLSRVLGLSTRRIQFTSDLLPSDITGISVYDPGERLFVFREGPIFTNILLADEINRSGPRTQSALLEGMNERTVTVDRDTLSLPHPFMVIATQNPIEHHGTYPLPDSELDRFLLHIPMGYPPREAERRLIMDRRVVDPIDGLEPVLSREEVLDLCSSVRRVTCCDAILDYLLSCVEATRHHPVVLRGVSPRGSLMWFRAAQALAFLEGRDYLIPDDVRTLAVPVLAHRLILRSAVDRETDPASELIAEITDRIPIPI